MTQLVKIKFFDKTEKDFMYDEGSTGCLEKSVLSCCNNLTEVNQIEQILIYENDELIKTHEYPLIPIVFCFYN